VSSSSRHVNRKFVVHTTALVLMLGSAVALYPAAQAHASGAEIVFLLLFALANVLILFV
jgi:hypothetical protein